MTRFRNLLPLVMAAGVAAAILGSPSRAKAGFEIRIYEGSTLVLDMTDNLTNTAGSPLGGIAAGDFDPTKGSILATYSDSNVLVTVTHAQSKPLFHNSPAESAEDVSISGTFAAAGVKLTVVVTDTDFQWPTNFGGPGTLDATLGNMSSPGQIQGVSYTGYLDSGNAAFGGADAAAAGTLYTAGPLTSNGTASTLVPFLGSNPYSMSSKTVFTSSVANAGFSFDNKLTFAPAPASLLMALAASPLLGLGAWLRRRKAAPVVA